MAIVLANGLRMNVERMAPSPVTAAPGGPTRLSGTVVCIHGILTDSLASYYFTLAKPFSDAGLNVFMYDLRGHGRSERPASGYSLVEFVADLTALLDAQGVTEPVYLVGNSFGGTVAFSFAARFPDRVAGIAIIESEPATPAWAAKMTATLARASTNLVRPQAFDWITMQRGPHTTRLAHAAFKILQSTTLERDIPASPVLTPDEVRAIRCPVFAIFGGNSDLADQASLLSVALPNFSSAIVEGQEHSILIDVPGRVRQLMLDWFATCRCPAGERMA